MRALRPVVAALVTLCLAGSALLLASPARAAVPGAPSPILLSFTHTSFIVEWVNVADADSYEINVNNAGWVSIPSGGVRTTYEATGLLQGLEYPYLLRGYNLDDGVGPSASGTAHTDGEYQPGFAPAVSAIYPYAGRCDITFTAFVSPLPIHGRSPRYAYSIDSGPWVETVVQAAHSSDITITGLSNSVTHSITIAFMGGGGILSASVTITCTPEPAPGAPGNVAVSLAGAGTSGTVTWSASSPAAASYDVAVTDVATFGTAYSASGTVTAAPLAFAIDHLVPGTAYVARVTAVNDFGSTTSELTFTPSGPPGPVTPAVDPIPGTTPVVPAAPSSPAPSSPVTPSTPAASSPPAVMVNPALPELLLPGVRIVSAARLDVALALGTVDARTFKHAAALVRSRAPLAQVAPRSLVTLTVRGLPVNTRVIARITRAGDTAVLGEAVSDASGMVSLPTLVFPLPGDFTISFEPTSGADRDLRFVRVSVV